MKPNGGRRINWMQWHRLCSPKNFGGIGFRDLHAFNLAMLAKQGWNMLVNPDALVSKILKAKYFLRGTFLDSQLGGNPSFIWRSIWSAKHVLNLECCWRVGNGLDIKVWKDAWLPKDNSFRIYPRNRLCLLN